MIYDRFPNTFLCLGNPGARYSYTRHNIGFMFGRHLVHSFPSTEPTYQKTLLAFVSTLTVDETEVRIIFPDTYMNNSGKTAQKLVEHLSISPNEMAVVYDDIDLPFGTHKIRLKGGTAGHKGLTSIVQHLDTDEIIRIRLGVGKPENGDIKNFVLQNFLDDEQNYIQNKWTTQWQLLFSTIVTQGGQEVMNSFNGGCSL